MKGFARNQVLIVDNEREIRQLISAILDRAGMETAAAASGEEALRMIDGRVPDLIILDIMMGELDGFGLLRGRNMSVPVVLLNTKTEYANQVQGFGYKPICEEWIAL